LAANDCSTLDQRVSKPDSNYAGAAIPLLGAKRSKNQKTHGSSVGRYGSESLGSESISPSLVFLICS
jgi:hypothetical protein